MVLLRFVHGLSFEEIATSFGVKSGAVRMRVGRALSKMRDAIEGATSPEIPLDLRGSIVVGAAPVPRRPARPRMSRARRVLERLALARPEQRAWALYDWANSAMMTVVVTAVFPIFFARVAYPAAPPGEAIRVHPCPDPCPSVFTSPARARKDDK